MLTIFLPLLICTTLQFNDHALVNQPVSGYDPWFSQDKFLHFSISAAITGFSYYASVDRFDIEPGKAKVYSISTSALIGIGKELYDKKRKGQFSWKDLLWDGVGITVGYLLFCY